MLLHSVCTEIQKIFRGLFGSQVGILFRKESLKKVFFERESTLSFDFQI